MDKASEGNSGIDHNDVDLGAGLSVNQIISAHREMTPGQYAEFMKEEDERFMKGEMRD